MKGKELRLVKCDYDNPENNVKEAALVLNGSIVLAKIGNIEFQENIVHYHHKCKGEYLKKARTVSVDHTHCETNQAETKAFQTLEFYMQTSVLDL